MAYPSYLAAALSGATVRQLAHWRRTTSAGAVLVPEISAVRPILYSFRDVVALRTCVYLRKESSLQRIRRAIGILREMGEHEHLSRYTLVAEGQSIVLVDRDVAVDLVKNPGQTVMAQMSDILQPFLTRSDVEVPALFRPREHIVVSPGVRAGHPVIAGTRVPYERVAELVADGVQPPSVSAYYPAVDAAAAGDASDFARYVDGWRTSGRHLGSAA